MELAAYDYPGKSKDIQARLTMLGLMASHLMLMGAFITAYGLFETTLERALWTLSERSIEGVRPFTETMKTEDQFKMLGSGSAKLSEKTNAVLKVSAGAAADLNEYRNSLVHGYLIAYGGDSVPSFMKTPRGTARRAGRKLLAMRTLNEPIQDLVLIAAWNLFSLVRKVENVFTDDTAQTAIEFMKADIDRAKSYAGEARHLRSLMNHEKY